MNNVFTHFISRGNPEEDRRRLHYAAWFISTFPESEFESDELLFYKYLEFSVNMNTILKFDYFQIWIDTELRRILHATNIRVTGCEGLRYEDPLAFETAVRTTNDVLCDTYNALEMMESVITDFQVNMMSYIRTRMESRLTQALTSTYELLNDTNDVLATTDKLLSEAEHIRMIYDENKIKKLDENYDDDSSTDEFVTKCTLDLVDKDSLGLFKTQLFGVEAQPGTGKTRFVLGTYVYEAIVTYHKNVAFYALEQRKKEVKAMLTSHHVYKMFGVKIPDQHILRGLVPDEHKHYVESAGYDLFKSGKYGKVWIYDDDLFVDDLERTLLTHDRISGPFDLVVIDYMGMIKAKPAKYSKYKDVTSILADAYPGFKHYVRTHNKAGIAIGQFNRDGVAAGKADKEITTEMAQGGMVVYRNTDYNIAISMTDTMKAQRKRRFSQPKVRSSEGFPPHIVDVQLGILKFTQAARKEA